MNTIVRERVPIDWQALRKTGAPALEVTVPSDLIVVDGQGAPQLVAMQLPEHLRGLYEHARLAIDSYPRNQVRRQSGSANECSTFGYLAERVAMRRYGCRACGSALEAPWQHAVVCSLAEPLFALLGAVLPEQAAHDAQLAGAIGEDWRLHGTPWTSGVINFDSPLPYHRDANNLRTWSAMVCWRRRVNGGDLHVPELDAVVPVRDATVIMFPGWSLAHAVTPLHVKAGGYRRTAVFYSVSLMRNCPPAERQVAAAQATRTTAEDSWRERQRAAGLLREGEPCE